LLVKVWSFCKDLADGRIEDPELPSFLAQCAFFPCFLSGPIHQYHEFHRSFAVRSELDARGFLDAVWRILHGLVKVLVGAELLRPLSLEAIKTLGLSEIGVVELGWRSLAFAFVVYLDFSGYSDMVIGAGRLVGIEVPENFKLPYLAPNLRDFWQRWHITFTRFLTQYVFVPVTRRLQKRLPSLTATQVSLLGYLITFAFCGFWHGATANFLLWGGYHGGGLALHDLMRRRRLEAARAAGRPLPPPPFWQQGGSLVLTFGYVTAGWMLFVLPIQFWTR
jgi:alginate O-acetyltransferase complex protein AlgI